MTFDTNAIIKLIIDVMGEHQIRVTARQSLKGALITGVCSFAGGILAGPIGLAAGGASGGVLAAFYTNGTFKSVGQILNELPFERRLQIADEIQTILNNLEITDLTELAKLAAICHTLSNPTPSLVHKFIQLSLPVIQRHIQM